ncbi:MAG: [FeFe] hydrogenase H-cluster radical SAM maturase HydE [Bacteroidales bacterium]|jgi:biotin synthase|nr:[FeFe] hydrogenase H-cluster radical SAM maturase HydE [Bacteroidales bacterium]
MKQYTKSDLITLLNAQGNDYEALMKDALDVKKSEIGNVIYLRGLIEYSNICRKNCFYCGVRKDNKSNTLYQLTDDEVYQCADLAMKLGYGSLAIQSGERNDRKFTDKIAELVYNIKKRSNGTLGITLSCGEQTQDVYKQWFEAGAHRYLLRIETSTKALYYKIHPQDAIHCFETRLASLETLLSLGYQVGTGVMIGLPFQTVEHLADDLLFFKRLNVAMVGMGPFIPHQETPLWQYHTQIPDVETRMQLTLKMIATLRLLMPKINIVAATANQTLYEDGREQAVLAGANIIMPNLTPNKYREQYLIYPDKACVGDKPMQCSFCLMGRMKSINHRIVYNQWGDSKAFTEQESIIH